MSCRVKAAIVKKEEVVAQLKQQYAASQKRADHLEGLLAQQRKQLLGKWLVNCGGVWNIREVDWSRFKNSWSNQQGTQLLGWWLVTHWMCVMYQGLWLVNWRTKFSWLLISVQCSWKLLISLMVVFLSNKVWQPVIIYLLIKVIERNSVQNVNQLTLFYSNYCKKELQM